MLRLREVHIRQYRAVAPDTKLRFGDEQVFLLGRNGSGKSTLLELLARLIACDMSAVRAEDDPVDVEWVLEWSTALMDGTATHRLRFRFVVAPEVVEPLTVADSDYDARSTPAPGTPTWTLEGTFARASEPAEVVLQAFRYGSDMLPVFEPASYSADAISRRPPPDPFGTTFLSSLARYLRPRGEPEVRAAQLALFLPIGLFQAPIISRFDEALGAYTNLVAPEPSGDGGATIESGHRHLVRRFVPNELFVALMESGGTNDEANPLTLHSTLTLANEAPATLLHTMARLLGAEDVSLHPRLQQRDAKGRSLWRGFDLYITWPGGLMHRHDQLSFGQKRLIAFLWYADVFAQVPLLTDELTNGLHSTWVSELVDLLAGRQAFHAVQNPLLLDMSGPGAEDQVATRFVLCEAITTDDGRAWRWRNPSPTEARRLYSAWDAGFQHLSEVLVSEGLW